MRSAFSQYEDEALEACFRRNIVKQLQRMYNINESIHGEIVQWIYNEAEKLESKGSPEPLEEAISNWRKSSEHANILGIAHMYNISMEIATLIYQLQERVLRLEQRITDLEINS